MFQTRWSEYVKKTWFLEEPIIESSEKILRYTKAMSFEDFISNEVIPK